MSKIKGIAYSLAATLVLGVATAQAQEFPKKQPVKIVVAAAAGGLTDTLARVTADFLQRRLGQAVVVENRPGASSTIGADYVAKAQPDGYTMLLAGPEQPIAPAVRPVLPYKFEDFTFLIRPFSAQPLILASPKFAPNSLAELIDYMKKNPGRVRYGTTGVGAIVHFGSAMLESSIGAKGVHVPFTSIAPVYTDLLAGNVDVTFGGSYPFPEGLKVLGSSGPARNPSFPDKPTLEEAGVKDASWAIWFGFMAPPKLPKNIADRLTNEITAVLKDPEAIEKYKTATRTVPDASPLVGEDFKKQALKELANWTAIAQREKIVVEQ